MNSIEKEFKEEMLDFKQEMSDFKQEMSDFKEEMTDFKQEMSDFKQEMLDFKKEMTDFKKEMLDFKTYSEEKFKQNDDFQKETREALFSLTQAVNELRKFLVVMEHNITEKIDTLFSAYSVNQDQHEEFNNRLNDLNTQIDRHSFKIATLENKTNLHSEQLSKLNS